MYFYKADYHMGTFQDSPALDLVGASFDPHFHSALSDVAQGLEGDPSLG